MAMRIVLIIIAVLLLALGAFLLTDVPERVSPTQSTQTTRVVSTPTPLPDKVQVPREPRPQVVDAGTTEAVPVDATLINDAAPDEDGIYTFSLGTHRVQLKGESGSLLSAEVVIKTSSAIARDHARRLRSKLVGMYFFLVSRRVDESVEADDGIERLEADLLQRYSNTIRGGAIDSVELVNPEVVEPEEE
jgi:hypothetical protein